VQEGSGVFQVELSNVSCRTQLH